MDTKTIDQHIREKSDQETYSEINNALRTIRQLSNEAGNAQTRLFYRYGNNEQPTRMTTYAALQDIEETLCEALAPIRQEQAIKRFLNDVEGFRAELEALKHLKHREEGDYRG